MDTRDLNGHTLKTPGSFLGEWLRVLGFTSASSAYKCQSPSLTLSDFSHATHGHHPVGHHEGNYHLRNTVQIDDNAITSGIDVWTGELVGPSGHLRVVGTLDPESRRVVLFHQNVSESPTSSSVMQTLICH